LSDITSFEPLSLCVFTDSDVATTPYEYCATASPISGDNAYVSSSGDDTDPGTIDYPVRTIERGLEIATSCGVTGTVYLEAGSVFTGIGNKDLTITSSVIITKYKNGSNPIIDMEHQGRFCIINSDITVSISDLVIRNGSTNDQGGAIYSTAGTVLLARNTFTGNSALGGGAIANINGGTFLHAIGCTFSKNDASQQGGALLNSAGTASISCCRFIENTATHGDAIYNSSGTVEAFNNWWGTNNPDPSALFGGTSVGYEPYLEINLLPDPLLVRIFCQSEIAADFTQNSSGQTSPCTDFFSGAVTFTSTEGTITPTVSLLVDGKATGILSDITSFDPLSICVFSDSDVATTPYEYCATASPIYGNAYVSLSGDDTNPGTIDYPVRTIERGIEIVSSCVATGTVYLEAGSVFTGISNKDLTITSSVIITRYKTGDNPIIDMEHAGRFCTINPDITVSISDLVIRNGFIIGLGGVIHNNGILNVDRCTFTDNRATNGGAIEQDAGISEIHCCRFANNIATSGHGNAIYNADGIVNADNNWWGSNADPATIANLLYGTITSSPWIQMAIDAEPIMVHVGEPTMLTVTFSSDCIPDGTSVTFSTIYGLVTPTTCLTIHSTCSALASTDFSQAQVCATTDNQTVCTIFNTSGYARFNFGCTCTDSDNQRLLIGSYNDIAGSHNLLMGYIFDSSTNTTTAITPVDLGSHIIENIVVYNTDSIVYIALLTKQNENCFLRLATCVDSGLGFSFTLSDPISMSNQTMKVQWIVGTDGTPYIATDMQDTLNIFKADLSTLTLTPHDSVTNVAGSTNSTFLYWAVQADGLYLVQGYDAANVATYKVNPGTGKFIGAGVATDVSSLFSVSLACSTCYNYLALGGTNTSHQAIVASYHINTDGTLENIRSTTLPASAANYCERCCCNNSHLLVATDNGLYSINPETFDIVASNVSLANNSWVNACWCCDNSLTYCSAINSNHQSYIFQEQGTNLIELLEI
jgi:predicted outer membrane repeat protein